MQDTIPPCSPEFLPALSDGLAAVEDVIHDAVRDAVVSLQAAAPASSDVEYITRGMAAILTGAFVNLYINTAPALFAKKESVDAFKMYAASLLEEIITLATTEVPAQEESIIAVPEERKIILPH